MSKDIPDIIVRSYTSLDDGYVEDNHFMHERIPFNVAVVVIVVFTLLAFYIGIVRDTRHPITKWLHNFIFEEVSLEEGKSHSGTVRKITEIVRKVS